MLWDAIQDLIDEGWELRHIRLIVDDVTAAVVAPKVRCEYNQITFDNDTSHMTIPNFRNFQILEYAEFSDTIDTKVITISDSKLQIHIEFGK